jgi:hypothetical protein
MEFRKKALIRTRDEWIKVYKTTIGGDNFPHSPVCTLPCLVLQADNPIPRDSCGIARFKAYIFISAEDIRELLKT